MLFVWKKKLVRIQDRLNFQRSDSEFTESDDDNQSYQSVLSLNSLRYIPPGAFNYQIYLTEKSNTME